MYDLMTLVVEIPSLIFIFTHILSVVVLPPCVTLAYMYLSNDIRYTVLLMLICIICKYCKCKNVLNMGYIYQKKKHIFQKSYRSWL